MILPDQQEPMGHESDPHRLEQVKKAFVSLYKKTVLNLKNGQERLSGFIRDLRDPVRKAERKQRQLIRPIRVDPSEANQSPVQSADSRLPVAELKRIDEPTPVEPVKEVSPVDEAPDRTFVMNRYAQRPDLQHVTTGAPSVVEDTAVHDIVSDLTIAPPPAESATAYPAATSPEHSFVSAEDMSQPIAEQTVMDRMIAGVRSFFAYYQKQRKADRAIRRNSRERVYRLKGYTTVAKVQRKRQSEKKQRMLRRVLIGIIALLTVIILFQIYNPFKDMTEWTRILGIDTLKELTQSSTGSTSFQTAITGSTTFETVITASTTTVAR